MNLIATIGVLTIEFAVKENQPIQLEGDVLADEAIWATLVDGIDTTTNQLKKEEEKDDTVGIIKFEKP